MSSIESEGWRCSKAALAVVGLLVGCSDAAPTTLGETQTSTEAGTESGTDARRGHESSTGMASTGEGAAEVCTAGEASKCLCPDGLHLGDRVCTPANVWGACVCSEPNEDDEHGDGDDDDIGPAEACYPGIDLAWTTCLPLVVTDVGEDYPLSTNAHDRPPLRALDLDALDGQIALAPNFRLAEFIAVAHDRYVVLQPHAIAALQRVRDQLGSAIRIERAFLSPMSASELGGDELELHIYGDAFDLSPLSAELDALATACTAQGGNAGFGATHVHCDFREAPLDAGFFDP